MNESRGLSLTGDSVVLDTGILIEYFSGTSIGKQIDESVMKNPKIHSIVVSDLTVTELYYVTCRLQGVKQAQNIVESLVQAFDVCQSSLIRLIAGDIKCHRKISLADCYSIAIAVYHKIPVIFKTERELRLEIEKKAFDVKVVLVDDDNDLII